MFCVNVLFLCAILVGIREVVWVLETKQPGYQEGEANPSTPLILSECDAVDIYSISQYLVPLNLYCNLFDLKKNHNFSYPGIHVIHIHIYTTVQI